LAARTCVCEWQEVCPRPHRKQVMTDRMPCRRCGKIGLVRQERVIDHGRSAALFYCGACNQRWQVLDDAVAPAKPPVATVDERRSSAADRRRSTRSDRRRK
jgi:transcription elongation factor Elf1